MPTEAPPTWEEAFASKEESPPTWEEAFSETEPTWEEAFDPRPRSPGGIDQTVPPAPPISASARADIPYPNRRMEGQSPIFPTEPASAAPAIAERSRPGEPHKEETRAKFEEVFREYDQLKARYGMALELTDDPQKRERLTQEFQRDAQRLGVTVLQDKTAKDILLDPVVYFPGVSKEDMEILFPGSKAAQLAAAAQRVVADAASGLTSPILAVAPLTSKAVQGAISGGFGVQMTSHVPELARQAGEASVTGDAADKLEAYGNLTVTSAFAGTALSHAQKGLALTKGQAIGGALKEFEETARTGEVSAAEIDRVAMERTLPDRGQVTFEQLPGEEPGVMGPPQPPKVDAVTPVVVENALEAGAPLTAAAVAETAKVEVPPEPPKVEAEKPEPEPEPEAVAPKEEVVPPTPEIPPKVEVEGSQPRPVATSEIAVRPDLMQFKRMDDPAKGLNQADLILGEFDPYKAGNLLLWEPKNPAEHGLAPGEKYIVANGHHRLAFGKEQGVKAFSAQILRESDGFSAADARALGAEVNIAEGKGTIYDQAKFIRNEAATHGPDAALARARSIGAKGRKAATIGLEAEDSLFDAFVNERVTPDQAEIIARNAPRDEALQRAGIEFAIRGMDGPELANIMQAVRVGKGAKAGVQGDLFGTDDTALNQAKDMAKEAARRQKELSDQISSVQGAAKRPEQAAKHGVDVANPKELLETVARLKAERARWDNWALNPDLVEIVRKAVGIEAPKAEEAPKPPEGKAPKLREGENQGDLMATQREDFALVGEKGVDFEKREAEKAKKEREAAEAKAKQDKEQQTLFDKRGGKSESNIFDLPDEDLLDLLEEKFGERSSAGGVPGEGFGRTRGQYEFPTYPEFVKWMDERYAEGDVEGMKLAFAEADTQTKKQYIKDNKTASDEKKAWVAHLVTLSPLPASKPAVPRTTPRPMPNAPAPRPGAAPPRPGGTSRPPPGRPPPRQQPPPPPPRQPTNIKKFDSMALVQLLRMFDGATPAINERLTAALGRFRQGSNAVELKQRLFWDTDLAGEVLGHEIGHFIDLAIDLKGQGKHFAHRIDPLRLLRNQIGSKQELRKEAKSLSRAWRGPFRDGDSYRDTATELFADVLSALFNKPDWVNQQYPLLHDTFEKLKLGKPEFARAYNEVNSWLTGDRMAEEFLKQSREAVERTQEELLKDRKPISKMSKRDILATQFVTIWHRAQKIEGVRDIGKTQMDNLEYSKSAAEKWDTLWADSFRKNVSPHLEKVSTDPKETRALFHAYSQAVRTIRERRAAGEWIEQNPVEARTLLEEILKKDAALRSAFGNELASTPDPGLYDLSAKIFRSIHDRGEHYVERMGDFIDDLNLGVNGDNALLAFNVRGKLLNPHGLTAERARQVLKTIRAKLTPQQFQALEEAGRELRKLVAETVRSAKDEGLISQKAWDELIEPNIDNYLPYAVLDYFKGTVRAGIMEQKGTAKDVADVISSSQLKVAALNAWRQQQLQPVLLRDMYATGGMPLGPGHRLLRASDIHRIREQNKFDEVSRGVIYRDGKPYLQEFPNDPGKTLERALKSASAADHLAHIVDQFGAGTHAIMSMYTTLSVPFVLWRNPVRGMRTAAVRTGVVPVLRHTLDKGVHADSWRLANNYARAVYGGELDPQVRALIEKEGLPPPRLSATMMQNLSNLTDLAAGHMLMAGQIRYVSPDAQPKWWKGGTPGRAANNFASQTFTTYEAFEKIANYKAALDRGLSEEKALAIMRRSGIPKPGIGGHWSKVMEIFFPWTRIHLQGIRATLDTWRDPDLGNGLKARFFATELVPRLYKVAVGTGVISGAASYFWGVSKDEDKNDPVMAEVFKRISPYKLALDDLIPMFLHDPRTGQYHFFDEFKSGGSIPKHYEVGSFRIPASEEGRLWGTLFYNMLANSPNIEEQMGKPGQNMKTAVGNWAANYFFPQESPVVQTIGNLYSMVALDVNPVDSYRGQPAANPQMFEAGGMQKIQAEAGFLFNQLGGPGAAAGMIARTLGLLDERAMHSMSQRLRGQHGPLTEKLPLLSSMVSFDNYGQYRIDQNAVLADKTLRANAKLVMSDEVGQLYDFYYRNLKKQDRLDASDKIRFNASKEFVQKIFGDLSKDGKPNAASFYGKAAHATGPDGSRQSRETVKRDLDAAAGRLIFLFESAENIAAQNARENKKAEAETVKAE